VLKEVVTIGGAVLISREVVSYCCYCYQDPYVLKVPRLGCICRLYERIQGVNKEVSVTASDKFILTEVKYIIRLRRCDGIAVIAYRYKCVNIINKKEFDI
jgi:hypothetical protein